MVKVDSRMPRRRSRHRDKLDLLELLSGHYAIRLLDYLVRTEIIRALLAGTPIDQIAIKWKVNERLLFSVVQYLRHTTDVFALYDMPDNQRLMLGDGYDLRDIEHLVDLYAGAFGPCLEKLEDVLRTGGGGHLVDWSRHARAFGPRATIAPYLPKLLSELEVKQLVEIGCGNGELLESLAKADRNFSGIGVDLNRHILRRVEKRLSSEPDVSGQLKWIACDIFDLHKSIPARRRREVDALCMNSVANAFFAGTKLTDVLIYLKSHFESRILVISDYYGKLYLQTALGGDYKRTLLHDVAQVISSQGVPPPDIEDWKDIYAKADVTLFKAFHYSGKGVDHFIHIIQL